MQLFEKDGKIFKHIPAGGHGGGITSSAVVKATDAEAAAFRASLETVAETEAAPDSEAVLNSEGE